MRVGNSLLLTNEELYIYIYIYINNKSMTGEYMNQNKIS